MYSSFSDGPHTPANMADSMEEVNVGGKKMEMAHLLRCAAADILYYILYAMFSQILEVYQEFHRLFGSRNS